MSLIVQKYGGTSVGDVERIKNVAQRVLATRDEGNQVVVVVSAMAGATDHLICLARQLSTVPDAREMDMLLASGEQVSVALLAMALHELGCTAVSMTGPQAGIFTDASHTRARISRIATERVMDRLGNGHVVIIAGFQGRSETDEITTLGRGGSDTSAVAIAAALKADCCEIYTDVDGVYTADPRLVPEARKLNAISHDEMLELASLGAKVLQSRAVEFAKKYSVPLVVRSSFNTAPGTWIVKETDQMEDVVVRGVSLDKNQAKITFLHVPDRPGVAATIFKHLADQTINVDMIVQNISELGKTDVSFTVPADDLERSLRVSREIAGLVGAADVSANSDIAKLSAVGVGMRTHTGIAAKMFGILSEAQVNIAMISTSEIKISCVIPKHQADQALRLVHNGFGLGAGENPAAEN